MSGQDISKIVDHPKMELNRVVFFCTVFLPNEINLPGKFHVDISNNLRVIFLPKFNVKLNQKAMTPIIGKR
jgi:hypothetical protein